MTYPTWAGIVRSAKEKKESLLNEANIQEATERKKERDLRKIRRFMQIRFEEDHDSPKG
jgi:regulator of RNase E activity RraA